MEQLLALDDPPTAVFCYSDDIAVAATHIAAPTTACACRRTCRSSVSTGTTSATLFDLTTIDQHVVEQARAASTMVLDLLAGHDLARTASRSPPTWSCAGRLRRRRARADGSRSASRQSLSSPSAGLPQ